MQDPRCDYDMDCNDRKLKILYERREFFINFSFFRTSGCFLKKVEHIFKENFFFRKF